MAINNDFRTGLLDELWNNDVAQFFIRLAAVSGLYLFSLHSEKPAARKRAKPRKRVVRAKVTKPASDS